MAHLTPTVGPDGRDRFPTERRGAFRRRVERALADERLQEAMTRAMTGLRAKREAGFRSQDFAAGREELRRRRLSNLDHLPELLAEYRQRLEEAGGHFHYCRTAEEARRTVAAICLEAGARLVTKSKSMASEEISLNQHLEGLGIEVVETDLGERMVQLTGTRPSHLVAPAIHLDRQDAARVFGTEPAVEAIQIHARRSLREKFIAADVGITGANLAIAETGTVMIVTNEGNAELTANLPPVHIALFGIDKLVASLDDAVAVLRMLPRSATGQRISTYVSWITGPSRSADIEQSLTIGVHGAMAMHAVVLDNGRSRMLEDELFREALTCIRCGACSNACPPFMAVSGHQFGHIYNGPIGLVLTPFHHGENVDDLPNSLCTQCNACQEACPVGIPLPRQILEHRRSSAKPVAKRLLFDLWSHPQIADRALRLAAPLSGLVPDAPGRLAAPPFRDLVRPGGHGPPVSIFASCLVDRMLPQAGLALEKIIRAAGMSIEYPAGQWCCGLICANGGDFEKGAQLNRRLLRRLAGSEGPIVTPSASCFGAVVSDAADWGVTDAERRAVTDRLRDSTRWTLELLERRPELVRPGAGPPVRVAYHDSCQSLRQLGLREEPRRLLELAGYEVVEIPDIAACCGFGGSFSLEWPQVAARLRSWKLAAVEQTGAEILASDNPGCLMHIEAGRAGRRLRVAHLLELVAERLA